MTLSGEIVAIAQELQEIFKTPLKSLPVSKDIPRLVKNITLCHTVNGKTNIVWKPLETDKKEVTLTDFLNQLCILIQPRENYNYDALFKSTSSTIEPKWFTPKGHRILYRLDILKKNGDINDFEYHQQLELINKKYNEKREKILSEKIVFPYAHLKKSITLSNKDSIDRFLLEWYQKESHPVIGTLKFIHQTVIICFLGHFSELLWDILRVRNQDCHDLPWTIQVTKNTTNKGEYIAIRHHRKETCVKVNDDQVSFKKLFNFTWSLEIMFDSMKCDNIRGFHADMGTIEWLTDKEDKLEKRFKDIWSQPKFDFTQPATKPSFCNLM